MELKELWISLFGTTELFGIDMGFWVGTAIVALIVIAMNVVFWGISRTPAQKKVGASTMADELEGCFAPM